MSSGDPRSARTSPPRSERPVRVDIDDRDPHARADAELVEHRRGRSFPSRVRHASACLARARDVRLRRRPPADSAAVGPGIDLLRASERSPGPRRSRRRTTSGQSHTDRYLDVSSGSTDTIRGPSRTRASAGRLSAVPRHARGGRGGRRRARCGLDAILRGDGARVPPGRRPAPRDAGAGVGLLHLQRRRAGDRAARPPAFACSTSTSTSTTATVSRRYSGTTRRPDLLDPRDRQVPLPGHGFGVETGERDGGRDHRQRPARAVRPARRAGGRSSRRAPRARSSVRAGHRRQPARLRHARLRPAGAPERHDDDDRARRRDWSTGSRIGSRVAAGWRPAVADTTSIGWCPDRGRSSGSRAPIARHLRPCRPRGASAGRPRRHATATSRPETLDDSPNAGLAMTPS